MRAIRLFILATIFFVMTIAFSYSVNAMQFTGTDPVCMGSVDQLVIQHNTEFENGRIEYELRGAIVEVFKVDIKRAINKTMHGDTIIVLSTADHPNKLMMMFANDECATGVMGVDRGRFEEFMGKIT